MKIVQAAGYLVIREKPTRQFLLMRHTDRWDLPKGHVDKGESLLAAARRELEEETGIRPDQFIHDPNFLFEIEYTVANHRGKGKPRQKRVTIYLATLLEDVTIKATEHPGYEWFDWNPSLAIQANTIDPLIAYAEKLFADGM